MRRHAQTQRNEGLQAADKQASQAIEHCLACGQCERHCPIHVPYLQALQVTRATTNNRASRLVVLLAHPRLLALLIRVAAWLPSFIRTRLPYAQALPTRNGMARQSRATQRRVAQPPASLVIISGCTGHALDSDALAALAACAQWLGVEASILPGQCCGALHTHMGDSARATDLGAQLKLQIRSSKAAMAVHLNTGCDTHIRQLLATQDVPAFSAMQWLAQHADQLCFRASNDAVAIHHPCTAGQAERAALVGLLSRVPGLKWRTLDQHAGCCGAAGDQFLRDPNRAEQFSSRWLQDWLRAREPLVLSSNIGCTTQISRHPEFSATILHPIVFLASLLEPKS